MTFFLIVVSIVLAISLSFSVKKNLELLERLDEVSDSIEESLDVIDESYAKISQKATLEVMSDEPVVKELVADIKAAKDALILVANKIVQPLNELEEPDDKET